MKKVLLPLSTFNFNPYVPIYGEYASYIDKLTKYNLLPIFVTPNMTIKMIDEVYKIADGLYFTGGSDIHPKHYARRKHTKTTPNEKERDLIEIYLNKRAIFDRKPILAICRGLQGLAVANGGSLIQHVPDVVKTEVHSEEREHDYDPNVKKHKVILHRESNLYKILKKDSFMANSLHHQSVEIPGKNLKVVGKSPEGIVEAIEHEDPKYFCIGVQNHPEIEQGNFFEPLFKEFALAVAN